MLFDKIAKSPLQKLLLVIVLLLSILIQYPQPKLDLDYYTSLYAFDSTRSTANTAEPTPTLHGVVIIVTGATSGLGLSLTRTLHGLGGTIVAIGRSEVKLAALVNELDGRDTLEEGEEEDGRRIVPVLADFADLASVSAAADTILTRFPAVDFLINNAGMTYRPSEDGTSAPPATVQGYDEVFGVNYLSHFLFTEKLRPSLEREEGAGDGSERMPARIVQISSSMHHAVNGDDLVPSAELGGMPRAARPWTSLGHRIKSYPGSKLAQLYHTRSLARRLPSLTVVAVCPSWVATGIQGKDGTKKSLLDLFALQPSGFGIAPILFAMFHPYAGLSGADYVTSTSGTVPIWIMGYFPSGVREYVSCTGAYFFLPLQKLFSEVGFKRSSENSYDEGKRERLEEWSYRAVEEWLG